jgi:hypothetical protein
MKISEYSPAYKWGFAIRSFVFFDIRSSGATIWNALAFDDYAIALLKQTDRLKPKIVFSFFFPPNQLFPVLLPTYDVNNSK